MKRNDLQWVVSVWAVWRAGLFVLSMVADWFLKYSPSFPYADNWLAFSHFDRWLYSWMNFDGLHYLTIARNGYLENQLVPAFFPVFPFLIRCLSLFLPFYTAALFISIVSSLLLVVVWFQFVSHFFDRKLARTSLLILLFFPTSFFFAALYTESLFLILTLLAFYFADTKRWFLTAVCVGIATATKVTGVMLVPALLFGIFFTSWEFVSADYKKTLLNIRSILFSSVSQKIVPVLLVTFGLTGLGFYMLYLQKHFNYPLYFFHVQASFGGGRQEKLILWPQVVWRYLKIFVTVPLTLKYWSIIQEFVAGTLGLFALLASVKIARPSWWLYALAAFFLPILTGTFSSMPRYILICFPLYILMATLLQRRKHGLLLYCLIAGSLLCINTVLFIQGYWVA